MSGAVFVVMTDVRLRQMWGVKLLIGMTRGETGCTLVKENELGEVLLYIGR
jgi:hypothetical protein